MTVDRHRKMKERLGMTEMRKAANRVVFGEVRRISNRLSCLLMYYVPAGQAPQYLLCVICVFFLRLYDSP